VKPQIGCLREVLGVAGADSEKAAACHEALEAGVTSDSLWELAF